MTLLKGTLDGTGLRVGIVVSRWNTEITSELQSGAQRALMVCGVDPANILVCEVPGAFEIPIAAQWLAETQVDGIVALGCVIKGETAHFEYVSEAAMHGIREVALKYGIPVGCGVLTTYDYAQAEARAGKDDDNKGSEAALAVVEAASLRRAIRQNV